VKRTFPFLLSLAALGAAPMARAEEGRFDAQIFRPSAAPRDLVMIQKSEVIGHLSPTFGLYSDISLDPLAIASITTNQEIKAVGARLQITALAGIGFYDWFDISLAMPFVAWQTSDNLRVLGSEGPISSNALGDLRFTSRIAIPGFNRKDHIKEGFGMAVTGNVNLPTGDQNAFTSDGAVTGGAGYIVDYRFNFGLLVSANAGVWLRPDRQFAGTKVGDMGNFGLGAEMYVVQRWGWSVLGGVFGHVSLDKFPDSPAQVPAEALLALRFQTDAGFTFTVGGAFGANCGFGAPVFRAFGGLVYTPSNSREQELIRLLKASATDDPDLDDVMGKADKCPEEKGPASNDGCPEKDADSDGIIDRDDKCLTLKGDKSHEGCPVAYQKDDEIVVLDPVHFATDKDTILEDSKAALDQVIGVLQNSPDIRELEIEGHTDVRANDAYNFNLSQRRVDNVRLYMISKGVVAERLSARGYGHSKPSYDDSMCNVKDELMSDECKHMTATNRRVVFRIKRFEAAKGTSLLPGGSTLPQGSILGPGTPLIGGDPIIPKSNTLLPPPKQLPSDTGLPSGTGLPAGDTGLHKGGLLPKPTPLGPKPAPAPTPPPSSQGPAAAPKPAPR
jgi:OmpA-OmpF porin, OOP family